MRLPPISILLVGLIATSPWASGTESAPPPANAAATAPVPIANPADDPEWRELFAELSKPSSYVKPITYGAVAPGLYDAIVAGREPANPVPPSQHNPPAPPTGA